MFGLPTENTIKVAKVSKEDFTLEDGRVFPHFSQLEVVPTVEEFQKVYDFMYAKFSKLQKFCSAERRKKKAEPC